MRQVWGRLQALRSLGLIERQVGWSGGRGVFFCTQDGFSVAGSIVQKYTLPKLAQFDHDAALVDLAHWLLTVRPNYQLVTEREIRVEDGLAYGRERNRKPRYSIERVGIGGKVTRFHPDLATVDDAGSVTVHELEHTRKSHKRLEELMGSFARAEHISRVHYYAYESALTVVENCASEANARLMGIGHDQKIFVFAWPQVAEN